MISLVATSSFPYDGKNLSAGDTFEACERDAQTLRLLKKAIDAPTRSYLAKVLVPDASKPKRGRYRRRDLRSDES